MTPVYESSKFLTRIMCCGFNLADNSLTKHDIYILHLIHIPVCNEPLGMEDGRISDSQITASASLDDTRGPSKARLNIEYYAWAIKYPTNTEWIKIDLAGLGGSMLATGIVMQGYRSYSYWVTKFKIQFGTTVGSLQYIMDSQQEHVSSLFTPGFPKLLTYSHFLILNIRRPPNNSRDGQIKRAASNQSRMANYPQCIMGKSRHPKPA